MNNEDIYKEIGRLKEELEITKNDLIKTKEHLKKYTSPSNMKKYYQNHKEEIIKKVKEYKKNNNYIPIVDKEKRREYNKIAYKKRKEKMEKENVFDKKQAAEMLGFKYEILVYNQKGILIEKF
jgi:hypothetical protein